ncbi:MAG TPA: cupin domain-containing protein [Gaiella sp.]|nr:cupin domain-containing protein [Gaiella sp.]
MDTDVQPSSEMRPFVLGAGEGARLRNPTSDVVLKLREADCGHATNVFEIEVAPGQGPPLHFHEAQDEWLYVLGGEFRFRIDDEVAAGDTGAFVFLPRHVQHTWQSVGEGPGRLLGAFVPPALERFFERFATIEKDEASVEDFTTLAKEDGMIVVGPPLAESHPLT